MNFICLPSGIDGIKIPVDKNYNLKAWEERLWVESVDYSDEALLGLGRLFRGLGTMSKKSSLAKTRVYGWGVVLRTEWPRYLKASGGDIQIQCSQCNIIIIIISSIRWLSVSCQSTIVSSNCPSILFSCSNSSRREQNHSSSVLSSQEHNNGSIVAGAESHSVIEEEHDLKCIEFLGNHRNANNMVIGNLSSDYNKTRSRSRFVQVNGIGLVEC